MEILNTYVNTGAPTWAFVAFLAGGAFVGLVCVLCLLNREFGEAAFLGAVSLVVIVSSVFALVNPPKEKTFIEATISDTTPMTQIVESTKSLNSAVKSGH